MGKGKSPAWSIKGCIYEDIPDIPTHWELFLEAEGIEEDNVRDNPKVLDFILKNSHLYFVPTKVLKAYKMEWFDA